MPNVTPIVPLQVFHVAYVLIKFANSPRPDLWVLERSTEFGLTYQPWQFVACEWPELRGRRVSARGNGCLKASDATPCPCDGATLV